MSLQSLNLETQQRFQKAENSFNFLIQNKEFILYKQSKELKVFNSITNQSITIHPNFDDYFYDGIFVDTTNKLWIFGTNKSNNGFYASTTFLNNTFPQIQEIIIVDSLKKVESVFFIGSELFVIGISHTNDVYIVYMNTKNIYRLSFTNSIVSVKKVEQLERQIHVFIECIDSTKTQKIYIYKIDNSDLILNTYRVI